MYALRYDDALVHNNPHPSPLELSSSMVSLKQNKPYLACIKIVLLAGTLSACHNYPVKLNGNPVGGKPLFSGFYIEDKHLAACINEHIFDQHITQAEDLKNLNCAQRSIRSLKGLEIFSHLLSLNLNDNAIESIKPVFAISSLEQIQLNGSSVDCNSIAKLRARAVKVSGVCTAQNN
jgi:Leucine-rich repeat (LRR) protein